MLNPISSKYRDGPVILGNGARNRYGSLRHEDSIALIDRHVDEIGSAIELRACHGEYLACIGACHDIPFGCLET